MHSYLPGERVCDDSEYMQGHGTQKVDNAIVSSVYGGLRTINKLISVVPVNILRYNGEVGDVVVGRITEVGNKKWRVDINSKVEATLQLSAINILGEAQRRKTEADEMKMREYFSLKDVLVAEVQKISKSGNIILHARNEKYKKLVYGVLLAVPMVLVSKAKTCFVVQSQIEVTIGVNGYVFISSSSNCKEAYVRVANVRQYFEKCKRAMERVDCDAIFNILQ